MNTCRLCKGWTGPMFKYSTRHYCHSDCGFKKWGDAFLDMIPTHAINGMQYRVLIDNGWTIERIEAYIDARVKANQVAHA